MNTTLRRYTLEEFEAMIASGYFEIQELERPTVELIEGEIVAMSPIGWGHVDIVDFLAAWSFNAVDKLGVLVRVQGSVRFESTQSMPLPDISWVDKKSPRRRHLRPESIFLMIEVADSSLANDLGTKAKLYARAGIPEYWVVDIPGRRVVVHRDSNGSAYQSVVSHDSDQTIASLAFPSARLDIAAMFEQLEPLEDEGV